ncbi:hypothetical protein [Jidongwangia harbinensis]|uniref:hypothetical protein n=1 Tax=Jidongwangia harbinensis TaxID=2878561 RepID=UPI001CDA15D2|nr:hypothetical protein [Jidongwangia harbinensis]MCA2216071.1 hypothetical protein [Jidongwangia harbinensis]
MPAGTFVTFTPDRRDPSWSRTWVPADAHARPTAFEDLPRSAFQWTNFQVSIVFKLGGVDFSQSMTVVSVSLLDFVLMLQAAKAGMRHQATAQVSLSDRGEQWWFSRQRGVVWLRIRDRFDQAWINGSCPAEVFENLVDQCLSDALRLMCWEHPELRHNQYLQSLNDVS